MALQHDLCHPTWGMGPAFTLRLGAAADTRLIAELMLRAGGGLFEQLLEDILPGVGAEPLLALALAINQADSAFGCDNAVFAERDGRCCGMVLCFPATDYRLPDAVTAFVPAGRLTRIEALIASCPSDSFYVHSLAVMPDAERQGVALALLGAAAELAAAQGLPQLSLHMWDGNKAAAALYRKLGFTVRDTIDVPAWRVQWAGPVRLLTAPTAALLTTLAEGDQAIRKASYPS